MKRLVLLTILAGALTLTFGCGDGMSITGRERQERYKQILDSDMKQINDDWNSFWLMDRPSRLTYSRVE